ncbi:MAG: damage-inducible protein DinB [Saprospiraceae bacterium]|nr:damage-inducible protein DinB [Saprospiraceae bacterium]
MVDFNTLYDYNLWANNNIMAQLTDRPFIGPISRLFCHVMNAHHIWNQRMLGMRAQYSVWSEYDFDIVRSMIESNHYDSSTILQSMDLNAEISYRTSKGEQHQSCLEDILFHVINHSTHHRAQILTEIRSNGGNPASLDYIFYLRD